jgi:hypothetical protein
MKEKDYAGGITDEWLVDDVLQRYSSASVIFLQHGPASRMQSGRLFADYPGWICKNMLSWEESVKNCSFELSMPPLRPKDSFVTILGSSAKGGVRWAQGFMSLAPKKKVDTD